MVSTSSIESNRSYLDVNTLKSEALPEERYGGVSTEKYNALLQKIQTNNKLSQGERSLFNKYLESYTKEKQSQKVNHVFQDSQGRPFVKNINVVGNAPTYTPPVEPTKTQVEEIAGKKYEINVSTPTNSVSQDVNAINTSNITSPQRDLNKEQREMEQKAQRYANYEYNPTLNYSTVPTKRTPLSYIGDTTIPRTREDYYNANIQNKSLKGQKLTAGDIIPSGGVDILNKGNTEALKSTINYNNAYLKDYYSKQKSTNEKPDKFTTIDFGSIKQPETTAQKLSAEYEKSSLLYKELLTKKQELKEKKQSEEAKVSSQIMRFNAFTGKKENITSENREKDYNKIFLQGVGLGTADLTASSLGIYNIYTKTMYDKEFNRKNKEYIKNTIVPRLKQTYAESPSGSTLIFSALQTGTNLLGFRPSKSGAETVLIAGEVGGSLLASEVAGEAALGKSGRLSRLKERVNPKIEKYTEKVISSEADLTKGLSKSEAYLFKKTNDEGKELYYLDINKKEIFPSSNTKVVEVTKSKVPLTGEDITIKYTKEKKDILTTIETKGRIGGEKNKEDLFKKEEFSSTGKKTETGNLYLELNVNAPSSYNLPYNKKENINEKIFSESLAYAEESSINTQSKKVKNINNLYKTKTVEEGKKINIFVKKDRLNNDFFNVDELFEINKKENVLSFDYPTKNNEYLSFTTFEKSNKPLVSQYNAIIEEDIIIDGKKTGFSVGREANIKNIRKTISPERQYTETIIKDTNILKTSSFKELDETIINFNNDTTKFQSIGKYDFSSKNLNEGILRSAGKKAPSNEKAPLTYSIFENKYITKGKEIKDFIKEEDINFASPYEYTILNKNKLSPQKVRQYTRKRYQGSLKTSDFFENVERYTTKKPIGDQNISNLDNLFNNFEKVQKDYDIENKIKAKKLNSQKKAKTNIYLSSERKALKKQIGENSYKDISFIFKEKEQPTKAKLETTEYKNETKSNESGAYFSNKSKIAYEQEKKINNEIPNIYKIKNNIISDEIKPLYNKNIDNGFLNIESRSKSSLSMFKPIIIQNKQYLGGKVISKSVSSSLKTNPSLKLNSVLKVKEKQDYLLKDTLKDTSSDKISDVSKLKEYAILDKATKSKSISEQSSTLKLDSVLKINNSFKIPTFNNNTNQFNPKPEPKKPVDETPFFTIPQNKKKKGKLKGFNVFVKRKGIFKKVNKGALIEEEAIGLGSYVVGNTAARSFRIFESNDEVSDTTTNRGLMSDFYKKGQTFIEKRGRTIKSAGELKEITFQGQRAIKQKSFFNNKSKFGGFFK